MAFLRACIVVLGCALPAALMALPAAADDGAADGPVAVMPASIQRTPEQRIGGVDRYGTAANVARWLPTGDGRRVIVTTGENFPDALSSGPMAAGTDSRMLLTRRDSVPEAVEVELGRLAPEEIVIVGGPTAVSPEVEAQLAAVAPVTRIEGVDRYATAASVAGSITTSSQVVVASGEVYADALAGGPLAAELGAPLLLARRLSLPPASAEALRRLAPTEVILLGSSSAISDAVAREIEQVTGATVLRIGGANRYDTAAQVARRFFEQADTVLIASANAFPDGLSGTTLAHAYGAPILLSSDGCASPYTASALAALTPAHLFYLGGPSAVTSQPMPCGTSAVRAGVNPTAAKLPNEIPSGSPGEEAFYFVPHQDDELISMSGGIGRDINAGLRVHLFVVYPGTTTRVKETLCTQLDRCLSDEQISASRNAELLTSAERLGVPVGNVHFLYVDEEASDVDEVVRKAMADVMSGAGTMSRYRSMSWLDAHPSHFRLGHGLRDLCDAQGVEDCVFYQSPLYQERPEALGTSPVVTPVGAALRALPARLTFAAAGYKEDYPLIGRHSVGWRSVPQQITWVEENAYSWAHGRVWASEADEAAAAEWMDQYQSRYSTSTAMARTPTVQLPPEEYAGS